jgi:S1-C subfamily serine protease
MKRLATAGFTALGLVVISLAAALGQQVRDANFDTKVARPAYTDRHPAVLFDEAHNNYHKVSGRYRPFGDLITSDGYSVSPNTERFTASVLKPYEVLIIANPMAEPGASPDDLAKPAFTAAECDVVRDWVEDGGALLLITDTSPWADSAEVLVQRFAVDSGKLTTYDKANSDRTGASRLLFSRENGLLADHPAIEGRDGSERISRVVSFAGQSLKGPTACVPLLKLSDQAVDRKVDKKGNSADGQGRSAAGRCTGLALVLGKGRVVILGEAGMLTAQVAGPQRDPMGMNLPGTDNRQFALNLMHWLSKLLPATSPSPSVSAVAARTLPAAAPTPPATGSTAPAAAAAAPGAASPPPVAASPPAAKPGRRPLRTLTTAEIVAESEASVALVRSKVGSSGTGFLVGPGLLATNAHVIEGEFINSMDILFPSADEGKKGPYVAELVYEDEKRDLALLRVKTNLAPLRIAPSYTFRRGEDITVIGNPGQDNNEVLENAISRGVMSTTTKIEGQNYYQLNVAINPGNSGGPVFDSHGEVIGIASRASSKKESLAYSIPIEDLHTALKELAGQSAGESQRVASRHRLLTAVQVLGIAGAYYSLGIEFRRTVAGRAQPKKAAQKIAQKNAQRLTKIIADLERDWMRLMELELPKIRDDQLVERLTSDRFVQLPDSYAKLRSAYQASRPADMSAEDLRQLRASHRKATVNLYDALKLEVPDGLLALYEENALGRFTGTISAKAAGPRQRADTDFNTEVERPAYAGAQPQPRVLIDEAHHNFLTAGDRYKPLADLLTSDGYKVAPNPKPFTQDMLAGCEVLVVANARGGATKDEAPRPAFTKEECAVIVLWIKEGGALLLISDQPPWGSASAELAQSLGVNSSQGVTFDPAERTEPTEGRLNFTRENKLLGGHPITQGRDEAEKINRVKTFIGQSLKGPEGSTPLLKLADTARDRIDVREVSAAGRCQGVAFTLGKGRVVVLGEGGQLSAQVTGPYSSRMGMSALDCDNRQWALNIMHWLSGLIGP